MMNHDVESSITQPCIARLYCNLVGWSTIDRRRPTKWLTFTSSQSQGDGWRPDCSFNLYTLNLPKAPRPSAKSISEDCF